MRSCWGAQRRPPTARPRARCARCDGVERHRASAAAGTCCTPPVRTVPRLAKWISATCRCGGVPRDQQGRRPRRSARRGAGDEHDGARFVGARRHALKRVDERTHRYRRPPRLVTLPGARKAPRDDGMSSGACRPNARARRWRSPAAPAVQENVIVLPRSRTSRCRSRASPSTRPGPPWRSSMSGRFRRRQCAATRRRETTARS